MKLFKYQGAGNDFLIGDNRNGKINLSEEDIQKLCDRHYGIGADGIMLLENAVSPYNFRMRYFNSDGSGGMMCGNGGRCLAAFANSLGLDVSSFIADDGPHNAEVVSKRKTQTIIKLKMKDVNDIIPFENQKFQGSFLDTGTRHLVIPVENIETIDVYNTGKELRNLKEFAPIGTNVNFIKHINGILHVLTYEKGVEAETFACGTGIVASAIAYWHTFIRPLTQKEEWLDSTIDIHIKAKKDNLSVSFIPTKVGAKEVWLTGPATFVAKLILPE